MKVSSIIRQHCLNLLINRKIRIALAMGVLSMSSHVTAYSQERDHTFDVSSQLDVFSNAYRILDAYYVDTLDAKNVIKDGLNAMLHSLDPYTEYYPSEEEEELKMLTQAKYGGIGSIIRMMKDSTVIISEPYEGMPAAEMGLEAGDVLLKIDDKDLKGMTTQEVSDLLRGEPGTTFVLKFQRPGEKKARTAKITRQAIKLPALPYYGIVAPKIGFIHLNQFTNDCFPYVRKAVISLKEQGAESLILDLRENGGGALDQAVKIVNLFVPKDVKIVETKGKVDASNFTHFATDEPLDLNIPLVVLVNSNSASASEIVSGALQDLDRAVIIGSRTYGKGLVQAIRALPYGANMKLTTAKYYIPSGRCIQEIDYKQKRMTNGKQTTANGEQDSIFYTANHRQVKSGKGIMPDIEVKHDTLQNILYYLSNDDVLIKYGTHYCQTHQKPESVSKFALTDTDFEEFKQMIIDSGFTYDRLSDKQLQQLKKVAKFEGYYDDARAEFDSLEAKLTRNLSNELDRYRKEITNIASMEIVKRWFYESGVIQQSLKDDIDLNRAVELLNNMDEYKTILGYAQQ